MVVRSWREDHCAVVEVLGDLDVAGAPRLRAEIEQTLTEPLNLVLDLSEVPFCDSVGLGVLVAVLNRIRQSRGRLILVVAPGMIPHLLTITNLDRHFETTGSLADARLALGAAA